MTRVVALVLLAAVGAAFYTGRPAPTRMLPAAPAATPLPVRGAIHVHSTRSDGSGDPASIAAAAARAGLNFVIFTDHGDATRQPDQPRYVDGVLCIDAVELSTEHGHLVALGLPRTAYPLGGEARDVLDDITRLGGFAIAAHIDSSKADLQWTDRVTPVGGLEWLNGDSEWRDESLGSLARALFMYPAYGTAALTALLDRPVSVLERWDALTAQQRIVAIAASDAHARLGLRNLGEPDGNGSALHVPSYENTFRMFSNVLPSATLSGDAQQDAEIVLAAIRDGRLYSVIDGLAARGTLSFTATSGTTTVSFGDVLPNAGPVTIRVSVEGPDDAQTVLLKDGHVLETRMGTSLERVVTGEPAVYRAEVSLPGAPGDPAVPWMVSNPIYVGRAIAPSNATAQLLPPSTFAFQYRDGPASTWTVEHSPASLGAIDEVEAVKGQQLSLRYALGGTASSSPFTAFVMPAGADLASYDRLIFTGRADHPTRMSVQVRERGGATGERWHRSVYLEPTAREISVSFGDMLPRGETSRPRPTLANVESVLFVLDTVNTPLGGNGTLWLDDVKYAK